MTAQAAPTSVYDLPDKEYKRRIRAWTLYDWANSAFATTILAAVLPVYYSQVAGSTLPSAAVATQYWSITISISVFIVAIISPILGTVSDIMWGKKKFLSLFIGIGVVGTGLLVLVDSGDWLLASIFFIVGRVGFGAGIVFYDALLPHIAKEEDQDKVSTQGYALGYLGGGVLLAINIVMIFTLPGNWGVRLSMFSVAIWWLVFSIPILRRVPEPAGSGKQLVGGLVSGSFKQIASTLREIRQFRDLFRFLIAFLIYNDGIGIVISVAAIYGAELGFASTDLILAILLVQFVGIPYSLVFGNLPSKADARQPIYVAFVVFNIVALPLVAVSGRFLLPQSITGNPSPDFVATATAVGQGTHGFDDGAFTTEGAWDQALIEASLLGEGCSFLNFNCEDSDFDATYATTASVGDSVGFAYNGQSVELTYSTGPDHGIWNVLMDGTPLLDDDGEPVTIDGYSETLRYGVTTQVQATEEGEHVLTLVNSGESNPDSSGNIMSISQADVLAPLRTSSLGPILAILIGTQLVAALFAFTLGRVICRPLAEMLDTKRSIILALVAYAVIAVWGFFLNSVVEFWFLAWLVAIVQGGSQALSRSLYATLSPTRMSGEFFGFFSIMSRFASFLSPLIFVLSVAFFSSSRPGVLSLIVFFAVGIFLLFGVDVAKGKALADAKDEELRLAAAD